MKNAAIILRQVVFHPAFLFEAGNVALAVGYATHVAVALNIALVIAIFISRLLSVAKKKSFDISYLILAGVGLFTAGSIIFKASTSESLSVSTFLAAGTYVFWAIGYLCSLYVERTKKAAKQFINNPQFHFGIGDMLVVNVQGALNLYAFPFTVVGFIKSMFVGRSKYIKSTSWRKLYREISSARIYAVGFFVGAISLFAVPHLVIAQILWGLAYLQYGKDE